MFKQCIIVSLFALILAAPLAKAQNDEALQKLWAEYMTPGPEHEAMAKMEGTWDAEIKMYNAPGEDPMSFKGTMVYTMILGGRYLQGNYTGNMMGQEFHGVNILAFDNAMKEFSSVWMDDMGTGMMYEKGKFNPQTNLVEMNGTMVEPLSKKEIATRSTIAHEGGDKEIMKMYVQEGGKERLSMEIVYIKRK